MGTQLYYKSWTEETLNVFKGGAAIKKRREALHLNQTELSARSEGVSQKSISRLEKGEIADPGIGMLRAVAQGLSVPVDDLLKWYEI